MSAGVTTEVVGVKDAIKSLRKIDPELRKQFNKDAKGIVAPIIEDAKSRYPVRLLSGTERAWSQRGNKKFPYSQRDAQRGLKFKVDTRAKGGAAIKVQQMNPAAAIAEIAGRKTANPLGTALDRYGRASRFLWPAAERRLPEVSSEMEKAVLDVIRTVNKEL